MLGSIVFNLDKEEDKIAFKLSQDGWKYKRVIEELDCWLRDKIKYGDRNELQIVRDELADLCRDENVNIWN